MKSGTVIDRAAHMLMEFNPTINQIGTTYYNGYMAFCHEERLYSVRDLERGIVSLVYAGSPYEAIGKVKGMK